MCLTKLSITDYYTPIFNHSGNDTNFLTIQESEKKKEKKKETKLKSDLIFISRVSGFVWHSAPTRNFRFSPHLCTGRQYTPPESLILLQCELIMR